MAHSSFPPAVIKGPLKDAIENILKAVKIERAREEEERKKRLENNNPYMFFSYYCLSDSYARTVWELRRIQTLTEAAQTSITLTADEYSRIKHWAEWKE